MGVNIGQRIRICFLSGSGYIGGLSGNHTGNPGVHHDGSHSLDSADISGFRCSIGHQFSSGIQETVSGKNGSGFSVYFVTGGIAAALVIVVHGGKIVVYERI